MPHNIPGLGAKPNGTAGAPVVGVERTTIGSAADVRQRGIRETNTAAAAKQQVPGIQSFEDNPLGAIGLILQEFAAGVRGTEGPVAKANKTAAQQMGARIQLTQARLNALKTAFDMIDASSPEQLEPTIKLITNAAPDFDLEESLRAHAEGKIENMKGTVEGALGNPLFQAFVAQTPGFENQPLKAQFEIAEKFNDFQFELQGKMAEQEALAPGEVKLAGEKAAAVAAVKPDEPNLRTGLGGAVINIDTDEVVTPGTYNAIESATGSQITIPIRSKAELNDLLDRLGSGELVKGSVQRTKQIEEIPGAIRILLPDLPSTMTTDQARQAGINIDLRDETLEGLLESRGDVTQLDDTFTELQGIIAKTPSAVGTAGFLARVGNSLIAQLPLIAQLTGTEYDPELLVPENYESTFREIGIESQRGRSATLGAAYALALAQRRRGGRIAQQDIERALSQIGGTFGQDPASTIQILQDLKTRTAEGFQTRAANLLGKRPPNVEITPSPVLPKKETPTTLRRLNTQAEVDDLPAGTRFIWAPTGKEMKKD